jgi:putative aminopeptidase FrvX
MTLPEIDNTYLQSTMLELLNIPSPTGFADQAISYTESQFAGFKGLTLHKNRKGTLIATWQGKSSSRPRALLAHVDTLGAMVKEILPSGRLRLSSIGGYAWNTVEGETCSVFTSSGKRIRGSFLIHKSSVHVYGKEVSETKREPENMEVRLDERVSSVEDVQGLGIKVGDFVAFDPRAEWINGFIRSRHLDDKACVACLLTAVKAMVDSGRTPAQTTHIFISNYEEVGHGAATGIPADVAEVISVDMAAVGDGQNSDEYHATICTMDSSGPYHFGLSNHLRELAETHQIPTLTDIYPHYGSDGSAFWTAGGDAAVALIGPGVDASHNYERTHLDALTATIRLVMAYLLD